MSEFIFNELQTVETGQNVLFNNDIVGFDSVFQCVEDIAVKKFFTVEDCEQ